MLHKVLKAKFVILPVLLSVFLVSPVAHAQSVCEATKTLFDNCAPGEINIIKSGNAFGCGLLVGVKRSIDGTDPTEMMACQTDIYNALNQNASELGMTPSGSLTPECSGGEPSVCQSLTNSPTAFLGSPYARNDLFNGSPSLLGLMNSGANYFAYEDDMTNLAYYWNDTIENVPFVNKAFAQTLDYRQPLIDSVLGAWKITRNLSFGLISIIFLYIGVMIILRKKVNQQTVVTIQYSLPKIAMSMFLIYFSYPIGAFLASLGWSLFNSGPNIVKSLQTFTVSSNPELNPAAIGGVVVSGIIVALIAYVATFAVGLIMLLLIAILIIGMNAYILIRAFYVYLKMVFRIIVSPIEFALYGVPGNEAKLSEWFLSMGAGVATLAAMGMGKTFVDMLAMELLYGSLGSNAQNPFLGGLLGIFFIPIAYIAGLGMVAGLPGKIPGMLGVGAKKR